MEISYFDSGQFLQFSHGPDTHHLTNKHMHSTAGVSNEQSHTPAFTVTNVLNIAEINES